MPDLVSIRLHGKRGLDLRLNGAAKKLENARPLFRLLGQHLTSAYTKNMRRGVDPDGRPLPPTQQWTRFVRGGIGTGKRGVARGTTPLVASGGLRAALGPKVITRKSLRLGFQGEKSDVAEAMVEGRKGSIIPKEGLVKTTKSGPNAGKEYVRIKTNAGNWYTKRVVNGRIPVKPQKRDFFYLGRRQVRLIEKAASKYLQRIWERGIATGRHP